ncbi:MAG: NAD(P)H-binding protein [Bacteroidota bacterium]
MHYVITGSLGNISQPIIKKLVENGHTVKVISSNHNRVTEIEALGATASIGSVEDAAFLITAFAGAYAIYTMVPPKWDAADWKAHIALVGENYAAAIKANNIKWVVNLSSIGAHKPGGVGPVSGLHRVENALNNLEEVNVLHLRPGYFFSNFFANIGMIKHLGILGSNNEPNNEMILSDTSDIALAAADALLALDFKGHTIKYLASDKRTPAEIASVLGKAVGIDALPWVTFTDEQNLAGMIQAGLPQEVAANYTEMGVAMRTGEMAEDFYKQKRAVLGNVKLENFATVFAGAFNA